MKLTVEVSMRSYHLTLSISLLAALLCSSASAARLGAPSITSLDCTVKGGSSDGAHMLLSVNPSQGSVKISGMQGIGIGDFTIVNGIVIPPVPVNPKDPEDRPEQHQSDPGHDPTFDGRRPRSIGYVFIGHPLITFGFKYDLPGIQGDPVLSRRQTIVGPESQFVIDRRTGVLKFRYAGTALSANCAPLKKPEQF